jgi:hypothetical protein
LIVADASAVLEMALSHAEASARTFNCRVRVKESGIRVLSRLAGIPSRVFLATSLRNSMMVRDIHVSLRLPRVCRHRY